MERLKKGLERARVERMRVAGQTRGSPIAEAAELTPMTPAADLGYVHTRRLAVNSNHLRKHRIIQGLSDPVASAYSVLRTKVAHRMHDNGWKSLVVTSPSEGAGKTVTAINLAISLAREVDRSVLLVDLDLRRPCLHRYFTSETLPGMSDLLVDNAPVRTLLVNPGIERLVLLPGHEPVQNAAEMLSSRRMNDLVNELQDRYPERLVVFDMPPVLLFDDVLAFSPFFQAALLVVEEGVTSREQLEQTYGLLDKTNVIGTVMNKSRRPRKGGHHQYGYM